MSESVAKTPTDGVTQDTGVDRAAVWWRLLTLAADHKLPIPRALRFNSLTPDTVWLEADSLGNVQAWRDAVSPTARFTRYEYPPNEYHSERYAIISFRFPLTVGDGVVEVDVRAGGPASDPTGTETPS